jgi:hypothetical protein
MGLQEKLKKYLLHVGVEEFKGTSFTSHEESKQKVF